MPVADRSAEPCGVSSGREAPASGWQSRNSQSPLLARRLSLRRYNLSQPQIYGCVFGLPFAAFAHEIPIYGAIYAVKLRADHLGKPVVVLFPCPAAFGLDAADLAGMVMRFHSHALTF